MTSRGLPYFWASVLSALSLVRCSLQNSTFLCLLLPLFPSVHSVSSFRKRVRTRFQTLSLFCSQISLAPSVLRMKVKFLRHNFASHSVACRHKSLGFPNAPGSAALQVFARTCPLGPEPAPVATTPALTHGAPAHPRLPVPDTGAWAAGT